MSERRKQNSRTDLMIPSCLHADLIKTQHKYTPNNILHNIIIHFAWISSGQTKSPFRPFSSIFIRGVGHFSTILVFFTSLQSLTELTDSVVTRRCSHNLFFHNWEICVIWPRLSCKEPTSRKEKHGDALFLISWSPNPWFNFQFRVVFSKHWQLCHCWMITSGLVRINRSLVLCPKTKIF